MKKARRKNEVFTTPPGVSTNTNSRKKRSERYTRLGKDVQHGKTTRKSFARIEEILEMPNLIEVQKKSYEWLFGSNT